MSVNAARLRLGFDIGGTFTDFVLVDADEPRIHLHKCLTTPDDPSQGALSGMTELLARVGVSLSDIGHIVHGTTLVANAIIERSGCKLGFLTTKGFRDILEMGTEQRYDIHDLFLKFPAPLVPRRWRREVDERVTRDGQVVTPLDIDQVRREVDDLVADGVEAIAVCLLHSYKFPAHEQAIRDLLCAEFPRLAVSISSEIYPELKEYERSSTTAANAYVQPLMGAYVEKLETALAQRGFTGRFHLMQSSGGLTAPSTAIKLPVRFLESGPAGGARATAFIGETIGKQDIISFDMGGTTAKACLILGGKPDIATMLEAGRVHRFKRGSGLPIQAPVIDMIEIGAGGGSIARVDDLGLLKVGPHSAGADPGPACYGLGGSEPTVTDANLVLGYLDPDYFLGGRMKLDRGRAEAAIATVAKPLGLSTLEAAAGILDLVAENMAGAARVHIVEKGHDPRRFALVAMGGAGPLHAVAVARRLGVKEIIVPPASGTASAMGLLAAPISYELSRSLPTAVDAADFEVINKLLASLQRECGEKLVEAGDTSDAVKIERFADMRLVGQMHEISVPLPDGPLGTDNLGELLATFEQEYTRLYTHLYDGARIEVINWRVRCTGESPTFSTAMELAVGEKDGRKGSRRIYAPDAGEMIDAVVYDRYALRPGAVVTGPAVIEERESTTILPSGDRATVDDAYNLRLALTAHGIGKIVVAADTALDEAVARIEADPIGLEIMWSRLINITEQCWHTVIRTAFSLVIGEAQDFACEILDARGKQIAHSPRAMPVFNLTLPVAVQAMIERFPSQELHEGDVLITNDPWLCAGHLFDVAIAVPVFRDGRVVAFVGVVGHVSDIGGTKDDLNAREIYDEGIQIPPMKLFRAGQPNEDLFELLGQNVRQPDQVLGDIHALVAAGVTGAERIKEFMSEYGMHDLEALATVVQGRAETVMRREIAALDDGVYEHVVQGDGIDDKVSYPIRVTVDGDQISVDFAGAPPQTDRGGSNSTLSYTMAHATYPLKCIFSPEVPGNAGCYRPMTVTAPAGSVLNCDRPMAVNTRIRTGWYIGPNIFGALAQAAPKKVQAFTGLPSMAVFYGRDADGQIYSDHLFQGGGQGASYHADGKSGLLYPTSAANTSVELFETRVPALVIEKAFIPDSGGAGRRRGGLGQIIVVRKLLDDDHPCQVGLYPNGVMATMPGLFGGKGGSRAQALVSNGDAGVKNLGIGGLTQLTATGQRAELSLAGGAGYGDPLARLYDDVQADLDEGYVSAEGAERDYCCIIDNQGLIDRDASDRLRGRAKSGLKQL
ncbi:MAG: hydantoinase B/oxoprolinase family protein [Proteobacteria bacterium]|nr:hydantoinase B/oxoprolinase family protein [Pseudomonadota bacterium]